MPQHQQDFVLTHGSYGQILLARAQLGHPHARFRVALLLACDRGRSDEALALLIELATAGHPLALDLLDACSGAAAPGNAGPDATCRLPLAAAQLAWDLGCTARGHEADTHACSFFRAAARGGNREAVFDLAKLVVAETDPELAGWLTRLETEKATGRHHACEQ